MSDLIEREYLLNIARQDGAYGYVSKHEILNAPTAEPTIDTIADRIESTTWYHINRNGKLVEGASGREEALYKAEDIFRILEEMGASDI